MYTANAFLLPDLSGNYDNQCFNDQVHHAVNNKNESKKCGSLWGRTAVYSMPGMVIDFNENGKGMWSNYQSYLGAELPPRLKLRRYRYLQLLP
ncbi:hypothetical protein ACE38W_06625 [Chitinophaga sp. Hz27]|uniref:hypothetical protein n=1 Tax=Chitinophaga sp. Hz27 TaxID=3347169 RepID=UPI0035DBD013